MNELEHPRAGHRRKALTWVAGIMGAAALIAGGALAGSYIAGGPSGGPSGGTAGQAATLNAALNTAASPSTSAHRRLGAIARLRRLGGMYGQVSVLTATGATRTIAFERGVITSAGGDLVVRAANGTTWTWLFTSSTVVRAGGVKCSRSDLSSGERVLVAGPLAAGARDARLIVIRSAPRTTTGTTPSSKTTTAVTATN
jgi:hypothetical protein